MAGEGLPWQTFHIPLSDGLYTKGDARAGNPPSLDVCRDVQFDEVGGLQTRLPYAAMSNAIVGGGSLANCRRIVAYGDELIVFTQEAMYSWSPQLNAWTLRAPHLAVSVQEKGVASSTGDQIDADRAELNNVIVYAWTEGGQVWAEAIDKLDGSTLVPPLAVSTAIARPRLVALSTRILLFTDAGSATLTVRAIDPASPGTALAGVGTTVTQLNTHYDVVRLDTLDQAIGVARRTTTTSYGLFTVTAGLTINATTKARVADGPVAVASLAGGSQTQVVRTSGTALIGDLVTSSTLVDVFTLQALATVSGSFNQVTATFVGATAYVFWTVGETTDNTAFTTSRNTVTTANAVGTGAVVAYRVSLAGHAFTQNGRAYVWTAFAGLSQAVGVAGASGSVRGQLQNTYFLYREDALLVSKATPNAAAGFMSTGRLPGVQDIGGGSWAMAAGVRRVIPLGGNDQSGFGARSPRDIMFTFDSADARRTTRLGSTLYVGGGMPCQYDGIVLVELGFLTLPFYLLGTLDIGGNVGVGTYAYKVTWRWQNALLEQERSTTAIGILFTVANSTNDLPLLIVNTLSQTLKTATRIAPAVEVWRTTANPTGDPPFYLTTSKDPTLLSGNNRYLTNDISLSRADNGPPTYADNFTDAELTTKETSPENGGVTEALSPPGAGIVISSSSRVVLGAVAGDPDRVWYSRLRGEQEIVSFFDGNVVDVPRAGGLITGLAFNNETLTVFRSTAIYALPGDGFDNLGGGSNYGPARIISLDVGAVNHDAIALTPVGTVFKSKKGWYILGANWALRYIGAAVADFDAEVPLAIDVVESQHQVRVLYAARLLMWDYSVGEEGKWSEWTIADGVHSTMWNGTHVYLTATGPKVQQTAYTSLTYGYVVELAWFKFADLQGHARTRWFDVLGEHRSAHAMRVQCAYNYDPTFVDDEVWTSSPAVVGGPLQVRHPPKRGLAEAIKIRLSAVVQGNGATFATAVGLSSPVLTSGAAWTSTWLSTLLGAKGNTVTVNLAFETGTSTSIDVRAHYVWDRPTQRWIESVNAIGVRVRGAASPPTVAQLEAAIAAGQSLATLTTPDPTPGKTLNLASMTLSFPTVTGVFSGGTYAPPTGEAAKLTGIALEYGVKRGIYRRLSAAQKA